MSDRYYLCAAGIICDNSKKGGTKAMNNSAVVDLISKQRHALDACELYFESGTQDRRRYAMQVIRELNPKTKEQLLKELFEAGDDLCNADGREHSDMVEKYRAAERAYEGAE